MIKAYLLTDLLLITAKKPRTQLAEFPIHPLAQLTLEAVATCPLPQALMGAVHYLPAVGTPLLIKPFHRPHPTPRHLLCCPLATNPHAVSLRPAGRT